MSRAKTFAADLPIALRHVLITVRRRIRAYVCMEGFALLIVVVGIAFWLGIALDWSLETSVIARKTGLVLFAFALALVAYRFLWRRLTISISDHSAAALLERRFPDLGEHLLTAVDVSRSTDQAVAGHPELIQATQQAAVAAVAHIRPGQLFNLCPLVGVVGAAAALIASIGLFAFLSPATFGFWVERIALGDEPWPRRVSLSVVGFVPDANGRRVQKVAQDDDYELSVQADATGHEVPAEVEIRFRLADGRRGRDTMVRVGEAQPGRDEFQLFRYQFKRIAGDMDFDVVGGDDRVRNLSLQVVDRPELFDIGLECSYPSYLARAPRRLPVTGGMRIPEGGQLTVHAASTKPLTAVRIHRPSDQQDVQLDFADHPQRDVRWDYGSLTQDDVLLMSVTDTDGVASREPYRVSLSVVRDELPQISVRLDGIGSAITPEAMLPLVGKITDDYALDRGWFEYRVDEGEPKTRPAAEQPDGEPALSKIGQFDLRASDPNTGKRELELRPGQRFSLWLKASDRYNLSQEVRSGSSQQFMLDVVTPSDLLALMERQELSLRQRFEAIYEKMTDTRNMLARVESPGAGEAPSPAATEAPADETQRSLARRRLRLAGALQNVMQSGDEIVGIAEGFDDLSKQLTNNRIDNPDLKGRLGEQIAAPLHQIAAESMPQLTAQLKLIEPRLDDDVSRPAELKKALSLADQILVEMKQVLDRMLELETYNEVVALLRDIISDQNEINRRTKERQKQKLRSLFDQ